MDIRNVKLEAVDSIHLAQNSDKKQDLLNTSINLRVS